MSQDKSYPVMQQGKPDNCKEHHKIYHNERRVTLHKTAMSKENAEDGA